MQGLYGTIFENVASRLRMNNILVGERLANRVLGMVHGAKSQFAVAFETMEVVGRSCGGKVEAVYTPNGFLKHLRLHPSIAALPEQPRRRAIVAACGDARTKGHVLMERAEEQVYFQFLLVLQAMLEPLAESPADLLAAVPPQESLQKGAFEALTPQEQQERVARALQSMAAARQRLQFTLGQPLFESGVPLKPKVAANESTLDSGVSAIAKATPAEKGAIGKLRALVHMELQPKMAS
eukprot:GGOE01041787.1.p1 GENE.GGOE01041787.1~~GGOE01041787.1.p1  ORF type:complete len:238 (+),score=73.27 GGOE01041787.1:66-779(+)